MSTENTRNADVPTDRGRLRELWEAYLPVWFVLPMTLFLVVVTFFPGLYNVYLSVTYWDLTNPELTGTFVGLENFVDAWGRGSTWVSVRNTLVFVVGSLALQTTIGFTLAALVAGVTNRMRTIYRIGFILPMAAAPVALATMGRIMLNQEIGVIPHLIETALPVSSPAFLSGQYALLTVILVDTWNWVPFMFIVFYAGLTSVPADLKEAAKVDGAPLWRIYAHVIIPYMKPLIFVAVLIRTIDLFREFGLVYSLTGGGPGTASRLLSIQVFEMGFIGSNLGTAAAVSIVYLIFVIALCTIAIISVGFEGVMD
ncbi:carbohydrate ABC transporter permease [Natrarchaeobius sp. A-rgal3]|uniref:carbohydrate ABC transporter permease n=1 Tax=Natrarchaeobius versutus TaxID=1679078 RepID=UPI00350F73E8